MGEQLDLFAFNATPAPKPPVTAPEPEPTPVEPPDVLPGQMSLFGDRWHRASAVHKALNAFDLEAAGVALAEALRLYPTDALFLQRAELVDKLAATLRKPRRKKATFAQALLSIAPEIPNFLALPWHRRLALEIEREGGAGAVLEGTPAGFPLGGSLVVGR
ncbi:MAG: hypothetical protein IPK82_44290 [Polyangiaceae bacterium]|nr:hypothetical protein [Polyangiaceae bacterium]